MKLFDTKTTIKASTVDPVTGMTGISIAVNGPQTNTKKPKLTNSKPRAQREVGSQFIHLVSITIDAYMMMFHAHWWRSSFP